MTQQVATQPRQSVAEVFYHDLDTYTPNLRDALPSDIPVERFKRVLVTAVSQNPELLYADRRTLFNAAVKCAVDGLMPDGRLAALVVFKTEVKQRDPQTGIDRVRKVDAVQYMPMVQGIRERMRKSGEVASAIAEAVFEADQFAYALGDEPYIRHQPPQLGTDRGRVVGAYAIIRLRNGEVIRDVMDRATIEASRNKSRAKSSLMWTEFYWEAAKKTVLRRAAKQAPLSSEVRRLLEREDEFPEALPAAANPMPEPEPEMMPQIEVEPIGPEFAVVDCDGVEHIYGSAETAADALRVCLEEARKLDRLEGWWESNRSAVGFLAAAGHTELAAELTRAYDAAQKPAHSSEPEPEPAAAPTVPKPKFPEPHRNPRGGEEAGADVAIPVPVKAGKKDWRTWAVALFAPKVRRCADSNELAFLLGANEQNLEEARAPGALASPELAEMERLIDDQWRKVA